MVQPRLGHSLKQNVRHGGKWGLRRKKANEKLPETAMATGKKISLLALCLNSLPSNLGVGMLFTFIETKIYQSVQFT